MRKNLKVGQYTIIEDNVGIGDNVTIGDFCKIMPGTIIGNNCMIMDYVKLMPGTIIGNDCKLDDYVNTSGYVTIGNNVRIKRCSMIGQATEIEDDVWIGSHITTTRIKYVGKSDEEWIKLKKGCFIGSHSLVLAGVTVGENAIVAAGAIVAKDCLPNGIYIGCPAKLNRMVE